ncbi:MAG TPA: CDP-glycerol glycerophosphotransferase family protein [Edaphocola sp.]|nr:CDP-glycerol glycerophosphotransferase family protein [Edaphocola sp.]
MRAIIYKLFCLLPIKNNKIIFWGYYGAQYGCSPKYISEYIIANEPKFDVVWGTLDPNSIPDKKIRKVQFASLKFLFELATAKFIITNYRFGIDMDKRTGQIYIQTWHSSLRLKKIEKDAEAFLPPSYIQQAKRDATKIDYLLSGCKESTRIFKQSFWYDGTILEIGTPRIDPIIKKESSQLKTIRQKLGLGDEKVLLYAPTFRKSNDYSCYLNDFSDIVESLENKMGGKWKVIVRLHPHLMNKASEIIKNKDVINASSYNDIQELLMITDFLITDYSSLMFDFLFSKNPVLLYLPDLQEYKKNERELYYDVEELPFLKAFDQVEIINKIQNFDKPNYLSELSNFEQKIGSFEKGTASKQLVSILKS